MECFLVIAITCIFLFSTIFIPVSIYAYFEEKYKFGSEEKKKDKMKFYFILYFIVVGLVVVAMFIYKKDIDKMLKTCPGYNKTECVCKCINVGEIK